jgi:signal transduction histidine kinase
LLLFSGLGWSALKLYTEREAKSNAQAHLSLIRRAYQAHITSLTQEAKKIAAYANATPTPSSAQLQKILETQSVHNHLSTLAIIAHNHQLQMQSGTIETTTGNGLTPEMTTLVDTALQGKVAVALQQSTSPDTSISSSDSQWTISIAYPLQGTQNSLTRVLLAQQPVDNYLAQDLMQQSGATVLLCLSNHIEGMAGTTKNGVLANQQKQAEERLCTPGLLNIINGSQRYITLADQARAEYQLASSPPLVIVAVEPIYGLNLQDPHHVLIILGMALFTFSLGVISYTLVIMILFIRPLRRLQAQARAMLTTTTGPEVTRLNTDDLTMLSHSFNQLSESLESESQAMIEQMANLLIMSDALISTLNLEHLLGEIASRLGMIMHVENVSLLLYGREMHSPWAVAQWIDPALNPEKTIAAHVSSSSPSQPRQTSARSYSSQHGAVTVYADPDGDITMAATTKMAAIPGRKNTTSGKRGAIRTPKLSQSETPPGLRVPRIPRTALRDLDMILARMVIQRKKIAYGEDIPAIYHERQENWAHMALEAGYRSVIAVPLLLQEQAIGAFILYSNKPYQVSSRDTFLLSTAAIQTSMAIQNAILFAEVKEKNEALQRANHLKSQFLANVTHELRTPLHSIISYGALILEGFVEGELSTEQEEHIQFMVRRAEDLSHLVDDMLDLSKIEADRIEVTPEPLDLAHGLTEVVNQLKPLANNKGLYLALEMEEGIPRVMADGHRLRQVAINLVSNAIKFTDKGGVTIRCCEIKQGGMVNVSVNDTGIGICPAALGYIFEAFRQADGSTTRQFGGTGLGLTIARKLIELQGGEVAVESAPGQGTTFSFTLPVAPAHVRTTGVR